MTQETSTNGAAVRLLVCDDSIFMRMAIHAICDERPDIEIVGEATNGAEAIAMAKQLSPDVITMDVDMPDVNGASATRTIASETNIPIVILSGLRQRRSAAADKLRDLGASDVIWKSASMMDIDIDGIAGLILEKVLFWGRDHASPAQGVGRSA